MGNQADEDVTPGSADFNRRARAVEGRVFPSTSESGFGLIEGFGLTKRELFAAVALQGWLAGCGNAYSEFTGKAKYADTAAECCVKFADALLAALDVSAKP